MWTLRAHEKVEMAMGENEDGKIITWRALKGKMMKAWKTPQPLLLKKEGNRGPTFPSYIKVAKDNLHTH